MPKRGFTSVTLPEELVRKVRRIVRSPPGEKYRGVADFISTAVEEKLEEAGEAPIISVKEVPVQEAKLQISNYLKTHPGFHYPSDIAFELGLDIETVFDAVKQLIAESAVEEAEKPRKVIVR